MRIASKAELLKMPRGTLFAEFIEGYANPGCPMIFEAPSFGLDDFLYRSFDGPISDDDGQWFDSFTGMDQRGESHPVNLYIGREGLYDSKMRYWVWEPDDVVRIIHLLQGGNEDRYDNE